MATRSSCLAYGSDRYPVYGPIRLQDRVGGISCFQALRVGLREGLYWCWSEVVGEGELSVEVQVFFDWKIDGYLLGLVLVEVR